MNDTLAQLQQPKVDWLTLCLLALGLGSIFTKNRIYFGQNKMDIGGANGMASNGLVDNHYAWWFSNDCFCCFIDQDSWVKR